MATQAEAEAVLADLDARGEPNVPQRLPAKGTGGTQSYVSTTDARERRRLMSVALAQGIPMDSIYEQFSVTYGMSEGATKRLVTEVRAAWDDEDSEDLRYAKHAARRRLRQQIREAAKDRKWTAVANLEKVLCSVEGTHREEDETPTDIDARLSDALLHELKLKDTKEVRIMIERQRMFVEIGPSAEKEQVIDAGGG